MRRLGSASTILLVSAVVALASLPAFAQTAPSPPKVQFAPATTIYSPVSYPLAIAAGDLNNDGIPDLAIGSSTYQAIFTALGNGDGTFGPWLGGQTTAYPTWIALADFNRDGNLDAAAVDAATSNVVVSFGEGNGLFYSALPLSTGPLFQPLSVTAADVNGDGIPDVVGPSSAQQSSGSHLGGVFVFVSNGDGTFKKRQQYLSGGAVPTQVALADLNGDHIPDVAVANNYWSGKSGDLAVLLGTGKGGFQTARKVRAGLDPVGLVIADFNRDGKLDVATVDGGGYVDIMLGNGDGTFKAPVQYSTGGNSLAIVTADFNLDGIPDLAVCNFPTGTNGTVSVLLGNGDGTFQPPVLFNVGAGPWHLVTADFNLDGKPDIATINNSDSTVSILINTTP